jgi:tetratricopeptide (TPR) repeat protein
MRALIMAGMLACFLWSAPTRAEWLAASSDHFVIYADDSERNVRRFSEQLERYHSGMALLFGRAAQPPSPSNRVTVYVVRNERAVGELYGKGGKNVGGFYIPRAGGSLAIVPEVDSAYGLAGDSMIVLLHEYAHHFLISSSSLQMPRWLSEGAAEFFATSSFGSDGSVTVGRPAQHRALELIYYRDFHVADLLDPDEYEKRPKRGLEAFYGKSWLLYHYLTFDEARKGQLNRYVEMLRQGRRQRDAALEVFGNFAELEKDLNRYLGQRSMGALKLSPEVLKIGNIDVRALRPGEAAMMPVQIRSRRGVDEETSKTLLVKAREIAARYPQDPAVLSALAEAEYDAGNDKEAIAAADAALAIDPSQVNAYVQKGYALFRTARDAEDPELAYKQARGVFVALNRRENDHPLPLVYFYKSFVEQGEAPTSLAVSGLIRAVELAPFDLGLRMNLAVALVRLGRQDEARVVLEPVAFDPHGGPLANSARSFLDQLSRNPEWDGANLEAVLANAQDDQPGEDDGSSD